MHVIKFLYILLLLLLQYHTAILYLYTASSLSFARKSVGKNTKHNRAVVSARARAASSAVASSNFTITAEILSRSLANFYRPRGQAHEFVIYAMRQPARADSLTVCSRKKQINVSFPLACEQAPSEGKKIFGERSEWDAGDHHQIALSSSHSP